jgi:Fe-S cluster assembly protein SufD
MPSAQDESWRRTDIRALDLGAFASGFSALGPKKVLSARPKGVGPPLRSPQAAQNILIHFNGSGLYRQLSGELASQGVIFTDLATALRRHPDLLEPYMLRSSTPRGARKFASLHGALLGGGTFLYVPQGVEVEVPLQAVTYYGGRPVADSSHTLVVVEAEARVTFVERFVSANGASQGLHVGGLEVFLGPGARLGLGHIQAWGPGVWNFALHKAHLSRDSELRWVSGLWGSRLSKVFQEVELCQRGARAEMLGVIVARGRQHLDYETFQDHQAPDCTSDLLYKGTLMGRSRSVWRGMIRVAPGANGTDAYQVNNNLLLDRRARADSIPGLEIEANEVRCTHGATAGQIDREQLFYLQSRGLPLAEARKLIVEGFFEPVYQRVGQAALERYLKRTVERALEEA